LLLVLKAFFSDEEDKNRPYLFFVNEQEIKGELHIYYDAHTVPVPSR
jgi:hypothetical protein